MSRKLLNRHSFRRAAVRRRGRTKTRLQLELLEDRRLLSGLATWFEAGPFRVTDGIVKVANDKHRPVIGAVEAIAVHPTNPDIVYIGAAGGGVWKTENATSDFPHWVPLTDDQPSLAISSLAFDPVDCNETNGKCATLYAGTGSFSSTGAGLFRLSEGILKTTDGGATWTVLGRDAFGGRRVRSVVPTRLPGELGENVIVVGLADGGGLRRSVDGGLSWTTVEGVPNNTVSHVIADPNPLAPNRLYAAVLGKGVYRSDNGGETWVLMNNGLDLEHDGLDNDNDDKIDEDGESIETADWMEFAVRFNKSTNETELYLAALDRDALSTIFKIHPASESTWTRLDSTVQFQASYFHFSFVADPDHADTVYVRGRPALYEVVTDAAGTTWNILDKSHANGTHPHTDSRAIVFNSRHELLQSDDGGIYRLTELHNKKKREWNSMNGDLRVTEFMFVAHDSLRNTFFGGTQDNGGLISELDGEWSTRFGGDGGMAEAVYDTAAGTVTRYIHGNTLGGNFDRQTCTADSCESWKNIARKNLREAHKKYGGLFAINKQDHNWLIYGGRNVVYESDDRGDTLDLLSTPDLTPFDTIMSLDYGTSSEREAILIGTSLGNVLVRRAGDPTFRKITSGLPGSVVNIRQARFDPRNADIVHITTGEGIYRRRDGVWQSIKGNLGSLGATMLQTVEIIPTPVGRLLVTGGAGGVFAAWEARDDSPLIWTRFDENLPNVFIKDLAYDDSDGTLVAATWGRGAWYAPHVANQISPLAITGSVYEDENGNGVRDRRERGLANRLVYIDQNHNARLDPGEPTAATNLDGEYRFDRLFPGDYRVAESLEEDASEWAPSRTRSELQRWQHVQPNAGFYDARLRTSNLILNFGDARAIRLSGAKFDDTNGNGQLDSLEPRMPGWTVYADINHNGRMDSSHVVSRPVPGELPFEIPYLIPVASHASVSRADGLVVDARVHVELRGTDLQGTEVTLISPRGTAVQLVGQSDLPAGTTVASLTFDDAADAVLRESTPPLDGMYRPRESLSLLDAQDPNGTWILRVRNVTSPASSNAVVNWRLSLLVGDPRATTDSNGRYSLGGFAPGAYDIREVEQPGWQVSTPLGGVYHVLMTSGNVPRRSFGNIRLGEISGVKFLDINRNGRRDDSEPPLGQWQIYLDQNQNSIRDHYVRDFEARDVPVDIVDSDTIISRIEARGLVGPLVDVDVTLDISHAHDRDLAVTLISPSGRRVKLFAGVGGDGRDFTNTVLDDAADSSISDGVAPFDGRFRPQEPLSAFDREDPNGLWQLEVLDNSDAFESGVLNAWSLRLTMSEPAYSTGADGRYSFSGLPPGTYTVAETGKSGWMQTSPAPIPPGVHEETLRSGDVLENRDFGNVPSSPSVWVDSRDMSVSIVGSSSADRLSATGDAINGLTVLDRGVPIVPVDVATGLNWTKALFPSRMSFFLGGGSDRLALESLSLPLPPPSIEVFGSYGNDVLVVDMSASSTQSDPNMVSPPLKIAFDTGPGASDRVELITSDRDDLVSVHATSFAGKTKGWQGKIEVTEPYSRQIAADIRLITYTAMLLDTAGGNDTLSLAFQDRVGLPLSLDVNTGAGDDRVAFDFNDGAASDVEPPPPRKLNFDLDEGQNQATLNVESHVPTSLSVVGGAHRDSINAKLELAYSGVEPPPPLEFQLGAGDNDADIRIDSVWPSPILVTGGPDADRLNLETDIMGKAGVEPPPPRPAELHLGDGKNIGEIIQRAAVPILAHLTSGSDADQWNALFDYRRIAASPVLPSSISLDTGEGDDQADLTALSWRPIAVDVGTGAGSDSLDALIDLGTRAGVEPPPPHKFHVDLGSGADNGNMSFFSRDPATIRVDTGSEDDAVRMSATLPALQTARQQADPVHVDMGQGNDLLDLSLHAVDPTTQWQNQVLPADVNGDGRVSPADALMVVNRLNQQGARALPPLLLATDAAGEFVDANGDSMMSPQDAMIVINQLGSTSTTPISTITSNAGFPRSWISADVLGGLGNDTVDVNYVGDVDARFDVRASTGNGNDSVALAMDASRGQFETNVIAEMGNGNDELALLTRAASSTAWFAADVRMDLGMGHDVQTLRSESAAAGGRWNVTLDAGPGNDDLWNEFEWLGGADLSLGLAIDAGVGNDRVDDQLYLPLGGESLRASLQHDLGDGDDQASLVVEPGRSATRGGSVDVDIDFLGGAGRDDIAARLALPAVLGSLSTRIFGDNDDDTLQLLAEDVGQVLQPDLLLDGGRGTDKCNASKGVMIRNCE